MNNQNQNPKAQRRFTVIAGLGCGSLTLLFVGAILFLFFFFPLQTQLVAQEIEQEPTFTPVPGAEATQSVIPTLTVPPPPPLADEEPAQQSLPAQISSISLADLYGQINPGVVNIQVYVKRQGLGGQGAGSGFVLDTEGHIVTNNHVIAGAEQITVIFHNDFEAEAQLIGSDANSDLAVVKVSDMPDSVQPLVLGDSRAVIVGEWVVAIGNPFGQQSSMSAGIVSAVGRTIPSGVTPFGIPEAIQTDAAINPGNSGGPLLNLEGQVIGVNAQIATAGVPGNAGVGFAIPVNVVRQIVPVLIESGSYQWPWLGVEGGDVNLIVAQVNNLETQQGAYVDGVIPGGPADDAGLQGSSRIEQVNGFDIPAGGDVIVAVDGEPLASFNDLLAHLVFKHPGDTLVLTILRNGQRQEVSLELEPRPSEFEAFQ